MRKKTCEVRNGVRKPYKGTVGETVWAIASSLPQPPGRKRVLRLASDEGVAPSSASARFAEYLRFHKDI